MPDPNRAARRLLISPALDEPASFQMANGALRLFEPADADRRTLIKEILAGRYAKPFVVEDNRRRSLHFSLAHIQSAMRLDDPFALELAYTREMMAFLACLPDPRHVLMIGLGGGSLAKYCYRHLPRTCITAVEIDRYVIALRDQFRIPKDDVRLRVIEADASSYLASATETADVVLLDGYDRHGITAAFAERRFYARLRDRLSADGMLVANLSGKLRQCQPHLDLIRDVFEDRAVVHNVAGTTNRIAFAFSNPDFDAQLTRLAQALANRRRAPLGAAASCR